MHLTMKIRFAYIFYFIVCHNLILAQLNIVPNGGFDSVDCIAGRVYNWELQGFAVPANECFKLGFSPGPNLKVPYINPNPWSFSDTYQQPLSKGGFIGLEVYGGRGYATVELKTPLEKYKAYYARFHAVPHYPYYGPNKWVYTDAIGMTVLLRKNYFQNADAYFFEEPIAETRGVLMKDTMNWKRVSGKFYASGDESYIAIGNFRSNKGSKVDLNGFTPWAGVSNMFYVDDVVISEFNPLPDSAILCANSTKVLDARFYDAEYVWSDGSKKNTLAVTQSGRYWVEAHIDGLVFADTILLIPEKEYKGLPIDTVVCNRGPQVNLTINVQAKYQWSTGQTTKSIGVNTKGIYSVTVTTPQCVLKFATNVTARECYCDFYAPTTFSPNDDGINDTFKPFINCKVVYIKNYKLSIFNRLGNLMFTTTNINDEWDGSYKNVRCSEDVYAWVVEYNTVIDDGIPYKKVVDSGDITIMK